MKVVHLITRLDPGGSAENTLLTCRELAASGWDALLASGPGRTEARAQVDGASVDVLEIPDLRRDPSPWADLKAFLQIYRMLRKERPEILHTHSAKAGVLGRWAGRLAGIPHIVHTPHGHVLYGYSTGLKNWIYLTAERLTAPVTDRLVALSNGERRESIEAGIGRNDKWIVIPSGVRIDGVGDRNSPRRADGPLRVGIVARLEPVKGIDTLVLAVAGLAPRASTLPAFEALVWGDGPELGNLRRLSAALGTEGTVRFVGTDEPVAEFLAGLDLYVQPSRNEGMGRALVLAQAAGLPVVASRVCGIPDVVREGETGLLVEPDDPESLANGIARLLAERPTRDAYGAAARAWVSESDDTGFARFSVDAMTCHLLRLYESLAGRSAPSTTAGDTEPDGAAAKHTATKDTAAKDADTEETAA